MRTSELNPLKKRYINYDLERSGSKSNGRKLKMSDFESDVNKAVNEDEL